MLLAMPFNIAATRIAAILKRIAAMLPLLHHCGNAAIARGIAAMPFGIAATPQYFPDVSGVCYGALISVAGVRNGSVCCQSMN